VNPSLAADDAMELGQLLQFLDGWLATDHGPVSESLTYVGCEAYRHRLAARRPRTLHVPSRREATARPLLANSREGALARTLSPRAIWELTRVCAGWMPLSPRSSPGRQASRPAIEADRDLRLPREPERDEAIA
jgi:hypothetical protein